MMAHHVGNSGVEDMQVPSGEDISEQLMLVAPICTTDGVMAMMEVMTMVRRNMVMFCVNVIMFISVS